MPEARSPGYFFRGQLLHLLSIPVLAAPAWAFAAPAMTGAAWLGLSGWSWWWLGFGTAVLHQVLGWLVFRLQLSRAALTRAFGKADLLVWGIVFFPLLLARPFFVLGLGLATSSSLLLPRTIGLVLAAALLVPALYTIGSVKRYFGIGRALGGDHFRKRYREMPLVRNGMYRWSDNAMYAYAFLILWSIALFTGSQAALALALFQHAYVWIHYVCTEKPDMELLFGKS